MSANRIIKCEPLYKIMHDKKEKFYMYRMLLNEKRSSLHAWYMKMQKYELKFYLLLHFPLLKFRIFDSKLK